ncbi:MAG TPA: potassium-transporting ATPase subunit KdpC [Planctomycetota bacterium]|nr:potassium-transporting ATPase subunit KdpC [Planctomycetota bacterium]
MRTVVRAAILLAVLTVLTGVVYPLAVAAVSWTLFRDESNGSVVLRDGRAVGSRLLGQTFESPRYFHGRPSAASGVVSGGSNLGPTSPELLAVVRERVDALRAGPPMHLGPVPVDLATASASGFDPHVSPAAALFQVPRVAAARGLSEGDVRDLVERHIEPRWLGVLGEPRVNVLALNLALDAVHAIR